MNEKRKAIAKTGIGSSEAAAACGLDDWKPQLQLYLEKIGELEDADDNDAIAWGNVAEPALARYWEWKTGRRARKVRRIVRHPKYPWMFASLDYESGASIVECKTSVMVSEYGKEGTDEVPERVILQVTQQMSCTGKRIAEIPAKVGYGVPKIFVVTFNEVLEKELVEREREFWRMVETRTPPKIDFNSDSNIDLIAKIFSKKLISNKVADLRGKGYADMVMLYQFLGPEISGLVKLRERIKTILETRMDGAGIAKLDDDRAIVRTLVQKKAYSVEPSSYVKFSIRGETQNGRFKNKIAIAAKELATRARLQLTSAQAGSENDASANEVDAAGIQGGDSKDS